jgi:uncharacterized protein YneR
VGVYELAPAFKIAITVEGNQLMTQATGQAKLPLFARSETKFFYKDVDAKIEFLKDAQGIVSSLKLYQNNQEMSAPRISERKAIELSPDLLAKYVGTYELQPKFNLKIMLAGGQLMAQSSGGPEKEPIFASSETRFFYRLADAEIEFYKNDTGAISHLVFYQNQQERKAPRISDKVVEHKEIKVSPSVLAACVGTYELKPGFDLMITLEGNQLMAQATGQGKIPIFAEFETKFFAKAVDVQIEFLKDDKGVVTHLMLRQGPVEMKAPRK